MLATQQYTSEARPASILPALDVSSVAWFVNPNGSTQTGQIESLELIDGIWWAACRYEQLPGVWILENRYAHNFFAGVGPEFSLQLGQQIWFKCGNGWQVATITDFYLESNVWFSVVGYRRWFGTCHDELPIDEILTTELDLCEDDKYYEYVSKAEFWADYKYEDRRDNH